MILETANNVRTIQTFVSVKNIKGTSFVGVRNYSNKEGEISNQTFIVGINYNNLLKNDLLKLQQFDINTLKTSIDIETLKTALNELISSLETRLLSEENKAQLLSEGNSTLNRSKGQQDAYIHLAKGLKLQDNNLYIYGLMVRKQIIQAIEYKQVKSNDKTIAKNIIKKVANLQESKFKQFKLGNLETLKISGITI